jgi:hypothetical protein
MKTKSLRAAISAILCAAFAASFFACAPVDEEELGAPAIVDYTEGYRAETGSHPALLHYLLPAQYEYIRNGGKADNIIAALFSGFTSETFRPSQDKHKFTNTTVLAYSIDYWITKSRVNYDPPGFTLQYGSGAAAPDARMLYSYEIAATSDGFDWRHKTSDIRYCRPLIWSDEMKNTSGDNQEGVYVSTVLHDERITFKYNAAVPEQGGYRRVTWPGHVYMFRAIHVIIGNSWMFEHENIAVFETGADNSRRCFSLYTPGLSSMEPEPIAGYPESGIPLSKFLTPFVTGNITDYASRTIRIYCVDGTYKEYTQTQFTKSYFIPSEEFIAEFDSYGAPIAATKVDYPVRIWILGAPVGVDITKPVPPSGEYR